MSVVGRTRTPNTADDLLVLVCTANLGNAEPGLTDMQAWVPGKGETGDLQPLPELMANGNQTIFAKDHFDLIAVGMQEATWSAKKKKKKKKNGDNEDDDDDDDDEDDEDDEDEDEEEEDPEQPSKNKTKEGDETTPEAEDEDPALASQVNKDMSKLASLLDTVLGGNYRHLAEKSRGQMRLILFCRHDAFDKFTDLDVRCENTGIAHVMANKGGIIMSLTYAQNTRLSFLSAHLAAHEGDKYYAARCDNLDEILNGAKAHKYYDASLASHHFFVMGDLNFRTRFAPPSSLEDKNMDKKEMKKAIKQASVSSALALVEKEDFKNLYYQHDELIAGIAKGELLVDFDTLPCIFPPTFKVQREAGFNYKQQRTPSYTDRILYRSANKQYLKPLSYEPCPAFTTSDHKPLRGAYAITPNGVVNQQQNMNNPQQQDANCSYRIKFSKMSCQNLPALDVTGTSDPYIMLTWEFVDVLASDRENKSMLMRWTSSGDRKWPKTKFLSRTLNPTFKGEELELSINGPVPAEALLFITVMDYDLHSADDLMCALPLNFKDLVAAAPEQQQNANHHRQYVQHNANKSTVQYTDKPLLANGKFSGSISVTIDIVKSNQPNQEIIGRAASVRALQQQKKKKGLFSRLICGRN